MCRLTNLAALALYLTTLVSSQPNARDDGRFVNSPLKPWFDRLASGKGLCCSFADGVTLEDVDWDNRTGTIVCESLNNGSSCLTPRL
jgi:hypothetical protein